MEATGHCLCGAVAYTAQDVQTDMNTCHCGMCRRWNGGPAFAVMVGEVTFEGEKNITRYQSSEWAERGFCNRCGTNLFFHLKEKDHYAIWMGSFDDQTQFHLAGEIFVDEKPPAYNLAGEHPRMTGAEFMASLEQAAG